MKTNSKFINVLLVLVILGLVSIIYSNHFNNPFAFDDVHTIENNIYIKNISNYKLFFKDANTFSSNPNNQTYRPLVSLSFAIDYHLAKGLNPFYFHLSMFLMFLLQLVLMFYVVKKILDNKGYHKLNIYFAFFTSLFYGLHSANAETINYISSRSDSYSTFFVIFGFFIYLYFPKIRKFQIFLIPIILGMLCKEQAVMFAPLLFVYILFFEEMKNESKIFSKNIFTALKKSFIKILPSLIVCLSLAYLSIKMQTESFTPGGNSVYHYLITQPWVYLRYFIAFFLPLNLSADTDWQVFTNFFDERAIIGYVFIVFLIICIFKTFRNKQTRAISFGLSWFLLSLLPTSSIIPLSEVTNDHRMFFPFVGLCLAVISAIRYVFMKYEAKIFNSLFLKMFILVFTVSVFSANAYGVRQRNKVWSSDESLWYDVTIKSPKNGRGLMNYGLTQMRKANYETALDYFNRALIYTPYYSYLHTNLGVLHNAMGNKQIAEEYFVNGINYGEDIYVSHYYYSKFLFENNRFQEALLEAEKTRKLSPYYLQNNHLLYDIYFELNKIDELLILVNKTLDI